MRFESPQRLGETKAADGRVLAWAEWGPADGRPVLFCAGAAQSRSLEFGFEVLAPLGVRLISVDRPGLGASSPRPGRTLNDWAEDVRELLEKRRLGKVAIVGYSQGAPFALACAAAGLADAVAVVAGTDELAHPSMRPLLVPDVAQLVARVEQSPDEAERFFGGLDAATLWKMISVMSSDTDRALYADPSFAAALRRAIDEGFRQGSAGYARDALLTFSPWPFDPGAIRARVDLWYGRHDQSPVHSPDLGATLARRIPGARHHVVEDGGGALPWRHGEEILRGLLR